LPFAAEYIIRADYRCHFEEMRDSSVATKAGSGISLSNANGRPYIVYWLRKVVFSILILEKLRASLYSILATQSSFQYLDIGETKGVPPQ